MAEAIGSIEERLLGAILYRNDAILDVLDIVKPEMFSLKQHSDLYLCMQDLYSNNINFDNAILINKVSNMSIENKEYIIKLIDKIYNEYTTSIKAKTYGKQIYLNYKDRFTDKKLTELIEKRRSKIISGDKYIQELNKVTLDINDLAYGKEAETKINLDSDNLIKNLEKKLDSDVNEVNGLRMGFKKIDMITDGLKPGNLVNLTGDSGSGKSLIALQIALNICEENSKNIVQYFSLEMSRDELQNRAISILSGINAKYLENPKLYFLRKDKEGNIICNDNDEERNKFFNRVKIASDKLSGFKLFIDETAGIEIQDIESRVKKSALQEGLPKLIIIDHLDLLHNHENPVRDIPLICMKLKKLAKDLKVPILTLHQFSNSLTNAEDRRPNIFNLKGSSGLRHNCDLIMLLYRADIYPDIVRKYPELKGVCELTFAKIRGRSQPTEALPLEFKGIKIIEKDS